MSGSTIASGAISGGISGAAAGSVIPGVGTAIGGAVGAGLGALTGWLAGDNNTVPSGPAYDPQANASLYGVPGQSGINSQINQLNAAGNQAPISVDQSGSQNALAQQNSLSAQLLGVANGTAASPAQIQMQQGLQQGLQQSRGAVAASSANNPIAALQVQQNAQGASQRQTLGDTAALRAQETQNAYGQLNSLYSNEGNLALNQQQQQINAQQASRQLQLSAYQSALQGQLNSSQLQQNGNLAMAGAMQQEADITRGAYISQQNQNVANNRALVGSILQAGATAGGAYLTGQKGTNNASGTGDNGFTYSNGMTGAQANSTFGLGQYQE